MRIFREREHEGGLHFQSHSTSTMNPAGTLEVLLISAQDIKNKDWFGKQDPYAFVQCNQQKFKSNTAIDQGTSPVWNQMFTFHIDNNSAQPELIIELYDADRFTADDFIGKTRIPLADVLAGAPSTARSYAVLLSNGKPKGEVKVSLTFTPKVPATGILKGPR